jgi:adenine-specific DNA-methyltransferase
MDIQKFFNEEHTIFHGDALSILPTLENESIDLIFVDPPYNIGKQFVNFVDKWSSDEEYIKWCYMWIDLCIQKLKPSGSMYLMGSTQSMPYLDIYIREKLTILSRIIWHYDSSGVQAKKYFGSLYEPILHCVKDANNYTFNAEDILVEAKTGSKRKLIDYRKDPPERYNSKKVPGNVWYIPRVRYRMSEYEEHPSQKPETLLQRIIAASSNPGDLVLDPFAGTFTTNAVAMRLQRRSIGIETQEKYIMIGLRRIGITKTYKGEKLKPPDKNFDKVETKTVTKQLELGV